MVDVSQISDYIESITRSAVKAGAFICRCDEPTLGAQSVPMPTKCEFCGYIVDPDRPARGYRDQEPGPEQPVLVPLGGDLWESTLAREIDSLDPVYAKARQDARTYGAGWVKITVDATKGDVTATTVDPRTISVHEVVEHGSTPDAQRRARGW